MSRRKYILSYILLSGSILFLLFSGSFLWKCYSVFGQELFEAAGYQDTASCAAHYRQALESSLSEIYSYEDWWESISNGEEEIFSHVPIENCGIRFFLSYSYDGNLKTFTNEGLDYKTSLEDNGPFYFRYNSAFQELETNMPQLYNYQPDTSLFYDGITEGGYFEIHSQIDNLVNAAPMLEEQTLFSSFQSFGYPLMLLSAAAFILIFLLFFCLIREEGARLLEGKRGIASLLPRFFYGEAELFFLLLSLFLLFLLPDSLNWPEAFLRRLFLVSFALLFLFRLTGSLQEWKARKEITAHLLCVQLFSHGAYILPFGLAYALMLGIHVHLNQLPPLLHSLNSLIWLLDGAVFLALSSFLLSALKLTEKIKEISQGKKDGKAAALSWPFASANRAMDQIKDGFERAAREKIKSERLKAELITNVSHDLKTPLTSVINYVRLLKKELPPKGPYEEHLRILEQKSLKLQSLTEDLLDLSRLSSGNETAVLSPLDFSEIVRQANGEFAEAIEGRDLELKSQLPKEPAQSMIDGSKMWRVMENLYGNAVKYAMPGTRIYVELKKEERKLLFSIRNTSQAELNLPPEELMERFVRGDRSRHTDGNGLGLSIVQTLVELQNGQFNLDIRGDLFTAQIVLPEYGEPGS